MDKYFDRYNDSLDEIVSNCEEFSKIVPVSKLSFEYNIGSKFKETGHEKDWLVHSKYYRNMAAFCKLYRIKNVLEIGTQTGAGALVLAEYTDRVVTVDMSLRNIAPSLYRHPRIEFRKVPGDEDCLNFVDFSKFDLIFIDIDHSGNVELKLHRKLFCEYEGFVFWDDINFSEGMRFFWNNLVKDFNSINSDINNYKSVDWHYQLGFGITRY